MKKIVAQLTDLLEQVALVPRGQRMQDAQPQLRARLSRSIGSTKGSHVVLFTASRWRSRHPYRKNLRAGHAGMAVCPPLIDRRHPVRLPPTRGDLKRKCWVRDGQPQRNEAPCRPLPHDGGARRARVRPKWLLRPRPAPLTANFPAGLPFNHACLFGEISAEIGRA